MKWLKELWKKLFPQPILITAKEVFANTILSEVLAVMEISKFDLWEPEAMETGEVELGELVDLEKAVFTLANLKNNEGLEIKAQGEDQHVPYGPCPICEKLRLLNSQIEVLKAMGWLLINQRLNLWGVQILGIRAGFKIVKVARESAVDVLGKITIVGGQGLGGLPPGLAELLFREL